MKRFSFLMIVLIISIFLSKHVGIILVYNQIKLYHKKSIRNSINELKNSSLVVTISLSKKDLSETKLDITFIEKDEFKLNGRMYDIIETTETDDSIFYQCINDYEEEKLELAFVDYVMNNPSKPDLPLPIKQILSLLSIDYFLEKKQINFNIKLLAFTNLNISSLPSEPFITIPDPPPKFLS